MGVGVWDETAEPRSVARAGGSTRLGGGVNSATLPAVRDDLGAVTLGAVDPARWLRLSVGTAFRRENFASPEASWESTFKCLCITTKVVL